MIIEVSKKTKEYIDKIREGGDAELILAYHKWMCESLGFEHRTEIDEAFQEIKSKACKSAKEVVLALVKGELKLTTNKQTRFVYYKERGSGSNKIRRYYGSAHETREAFAASWYDTGYAKDEEHMKALETLGWTKISLDEARKEDNK